MPGKERSPLRAEIVGEAERGAEYAAHFVIPSEARNLSFFSWALTEERFLASRGMTKGVAQFFRSLQMQRARLVELPAYVASIGTVVKNKN